MRFTESIKSVWFYIDITVSLRAYTAAQITEIPRIFKLFFLRIIYALIGSCCFT